MTTRRTDSIHEAEQTPPLPPGDPRGKVESPSGDNMQGANGLRPDPDADSNEPDGGDQDIDTAGTDADDQSPTKAQGTGNAPTRSKG